MLRIAFTLLLLVVMPQARSSTEARLLSQSQSGQTVLFNLGSLDGIKSGDFAVILKQIRPIDKKKKDLRIVPAAKARNVKVNTNSSIWILYKIYDPELMVKGDQYILMSESAMLKGRERPAIGRTTVIGKNQKATEAVESALSGDHDNLAKLDDEYEKVTPLHEREYRSDSDFELFDVEQWEKDRNIRYRTALYKSPHQNEFRRRLRLATFEKLVTAYIKRVNDPDFNYEDFYDEQMKSEFANEFRVRSNFNTEYETFLHAEATKASNDAKLFRSILEKGEGWSEDYSDEELTLVLSEVSVLQEKDRRAFVSAKPTRYSVALDYGQTLTDAQTDQDPGYRRDSLYSLDASIEVTPFLKHEDLERFTFEGGFRSNNTALLSDGINSSVDERSLSAGINWYPLYAPYTLEATVLFVGAYIRSGFAKLEAPSAGESGNYTVLSVPGFKGGVKYTFRNRVGLRLLASLETLKLEQYETNRPGGVLPGSANLAEGKVGFGIAYAF